MSTESAKFYFVAADGANSENRSKFGPPTLPYVESLQKALDRTASGEDPCVEVIALEIAEFIALLEQLPEASQEALQNCVVWPYYRSRPDEENHDVFSNLPDSFPEGSVINDARNPNASLGDKWRDYQLAEKGGIPIPETVEISDISEIDDGFSFDYPIVIKGHPSGRGIDVHLCETATEAKQAFQSCIQKGLKVVAQEYIETSHGRDLRILVVDGKIVLTLGREAAPGKFHSNVSGGGQYIENPILNEEDLGIIQKVIDTFPVDVGGIDFLYGPDGLVFTEINWAPGWSGLAEGLTDFLANLIQQRLKLAKKVEGL
ncbi:hypothetical protein HN680_00860 [Candidatus Peregrinibacteria bacterium]|nr:hypothetical protein [Candidatus Peregrinibacteria bacterium]